MQFRSVQICLWMHCYSSRFACFLEGFNWLHMSRDWEYPLFIFKSHFDLYNFVTFMLNLLSKTSQTSVYRTLRLLYMTQQVAFSDIRLHMFSNAQIVHKFIIKSSSTLSQSWSRSICEENGISKYWFFFLL